MKKKIILDDVLSDMNQLIEEIDVKNIKEKTEELQHYIDFMKKLPYLKDTSTPVKDESSNDYQYKDIQEASDPQGYKLERNLKGGKLDTGDNKSIYVPESIIRAMSFLPGDLISPKKINERHYSFTLVERPEVPDTTDREQIDYGIVKYKDNLWMVEEHIVRGKNELIKINDTFFAFILKEHEVQEYSLIEGDVVDIAYSMQHDNGDLIHKVIWKHENKQIDYTPPSPASFYKKKNIEGTPNEYEGPDLDSKRVLMVGLEGRKTVMKQVVESFNGIFEWTSGNDSSTRYEPMIKRSDIVIAFRSGVSHKGTNRAVEYSKKYKKIFLDTPTNGVDSFVVALNEAGNKLGLSSMKTTI